MPTIGERVLTHPPQCLAGVQVTQAPIVENRGPDSVAFRLSLGGREDFGEIHGYPLRAYNPAVGNSPEFISPLSVKWRDRSPIVIFDSNIHGYCGEMDDSAKLRGEGAAEIYLCPRCSRTAFGIIVQFDYTDACYDLWEDEPTIRIEDYFTNILISATCEACKLISRVLDMDL